MIAIRVIGWVLLLAGCAVLGRDVLAWHDTGVVEPVTLQQLWFELGRTSLAQFEGSLAPWMLVIARPALAPWAAPCILAAGVLFAWLGRKRGKAKR